MYHVTTMCLVNIHAVLFPSIFKVKLVIQQTNEVLQKGQCTTLFELVVTFCVTCRTLQNLISYNNLSILIKLVPA